MKIFGMGVPEIMILLMTILLYALFVLILYLIIKKAVKNGILEAHKQIGESESILPHQESPTREQ